MPYERLFPNLVARNKLFPVLTADLYQAYACWRVCERRTHSIVKSVLPATPASVYRLHTAVVEKA